MTELMGSDLPNGAVLATNVQHKNSPQFADQGRRRARRHSAKVLSRIQKISKSLNRVGGASRFARTNHWHGSVQVCSESQNYRSCMALGPIPPKHAAEKPPRVALGAPPFIPRRGTVRESVVGERRATQGEPILSLAWCTPVVLKMALRSTLCLKRPWSRCRCPNTMNV